MKIWQVVECHETYVDNYTDDGYIDYSEINKGYYSTKEKAQAKFDSLTKKFWNDEYKYCMRDFKILEHELDNQ